MRKKLLMLLLTALPVLAFAVSPDSAAVAAQLKQINIRYSRAFEKADSSLFTGCYTPDACLLPANSPALCGRTGQLAFYRFALRSGIRKINFQTVALLGLSDTMVTEQGTYELSGGDGAILDKGKYLVVWKKTDNGWQMYRDMFSSDTPLKKS